MISDISETCLLNPVSAGKSILMLSVLITAKWQGLLGAMRQIGIERRLNLKRVTSLEITVQKKKGIKVDGLNDVDPPLHFLFLHC